MDLEKIIQVLISLLEEQEGVKISYTLEKREEDVVEEKSA